MLLYVVFEILKICMCLCSRTRWNWRLLGAREWL